VASTRNVTVAVGANANKLSFHIDPYWWGIVENVENRNRSSGVEIRAGKCLRKKPRFLRFFLILKNLKKSKILVYSFF